MPIAYAPLGVNGKRTYAEHTSSRARIRHQVSAERLLIAQVGGADIGVQSEAHLFGETNALRSTACAYHWRRGLGGFCDVGHLPPHAVAASGRACRAPGHEPTRTSEKDADGHDG